MHKSHSRPYGTTLLQRLLALLVAICVVCGAPAAAAIETPKLRASTLEGSLVVELDGGDNDRSADRRSTADLDTLSETPDVPVARASRRWVSRAACCDNHIVSSASLASPGHDPPKTIRYCTLLI